MTDDDEDRGTYYAVVRVELEDVTAKQAAMFWHDLGEHTISVDGLEATVVAVDPEPADD